MNLIQWIKAQLKLQRKLLPSYAAIGKQLSEGKVELAYQTGLHRELCRGKVLALELVLKQAQDAHAAEQPPQINFKASGDVMTADPPGAYIRCEREQDDESRVTIRALRGSPSLIADFTVHIPPGVDHTEETMQVAAAVYWSWWRGNLLGRRPLGPGAQPPIDGSSERSEAATTTSSSRTLDTDSR